MRSVTQRSFAGGELDPALHARADLAKYGVSAKTVRNFIVRKEGAAASRPGLIFQAEVKSSASVAALIPFVFNSDQSYVLVLGDYTMRFMQAAGYLQISTPAAWSAIPIYAIGDLVSNAGVNYYAKYVNQASAPPSANWHTLTGTALEIPTPWAAADIQAVRHTQSADVMVMVHDGYKPHELKRLGATNWTLTEVVFAPRFGRPYGCVATAGGAGTTVFRYRVTALGGKNGNEESLAGFGVSPVAMSAQIPIAAAGPWPVITNIAHGYVTGDQITLIPITTSPLFDPATDNLSFTITVTGATGFTLDGTIGARAAARTFSAIPTSAKVTAATPTSAAPIVITWIAVTGATRYAVYKESSGIFGFIGYALPRAAPTFSDINIVPDTGDSHPVETDHFRDNNPACAVYAQQRLILASSTDDPETVWASRVGDFYNFAVSSPIQDDDAVELTLAGRQVNRIWNIVDIGRLLLFTGGGVYSISGDANGVLTPTAINLRQQVYSGADDLLPLTVVNSAIYVQARGSQVRDLGFSFQDDGYRSGDLTAYANHLVAGMTIVDWAYQETPNSVIWMVRSDGALLGLTYIKEQEVVAWHRHDSGSGIFERCCVIPENGEDVLYVVVRRVINGVSKRYVERLHTRQIATLEEGFFVDCGLTYDGLNLTATTLTLTGFGWIPTSQLTLTASAAQFVAGDVGNAYVLHVGAVSVVCTVYQYVSATVVYINPDIDVPVAFQAVAIADWSRAVDELSGLGHLEGQRVAILGDGSVISDGSDNTYVVTAGAITLTSPYSLIHIGLPITADLELLNLEDPEAETLADKRILITEATILVESSAAPSVGYDAAHLRPVKPPLPVNLGDPPPLTTGGFNIGLNSTWNDNGRVFIRHTDPTPLTVLGVVRRGRVEKAPSQ